jgi:hypothetical protein
MKDKSRHEIIEGLVCKQCGKVFSARKQRVEIGFGIYCSRNCASHAKAEKTGKKYIGKESGKVSYDKLKGAYYVYWFDSDTLKRKTTSYARWYWEVNIGIIPDGYVASYKDKNPKNINPDNIVLSSPNDIGKAISERTKGKIFSNETRKKMSIVRKKKKLSDEHKKHIGESMKGEKNRFWIDGRSYIEYPPEFDGILKRRVRRRDKNVCRACNKDARHTKGAVHHMDGDKMNSDIGNLILLCKDCHLVVHRGFDTTNPIIKLLQSLLVFTT